MRVKRFVGDNVAETMGKIKRELGTDAVILQTRQFREGGILGFFGKQKVEIMAAIEEQPLMNKQPQPQPQPVSSAKGNPYSMHKESYGSSASNAAPNPYVNPKNPSFSGVGESGRGSVGCKVKPWNFCLGSRRLSA
jgi:flagellar biosynthesis protein FlhF